MTTDRYDSMSTADLLREVCRKLDRIEKQGAPKQPPVVRVDTTRTLGPRVQDFDGPFNATA